MKIKTILFILSLSFLTNSFALTRHVPQSLSAGGKNNQSFFWHDDCRIDIYNLSDSDVWVHGLFNSNEQLSFPISWRDKAAHAVYLENMWARGGCDDGMFINVVKWPEGYTIYSNYTYTNSVVYLVPWLGQSGIKAEVKSK